ncbi:MAG: hypothetical protein OXB84_00880, partial [Halobacteriovoraceae bacterium]|nr:hypothetical protein [Halobacteriovoraceae bacterium]
LFFSEHDYSTIGKKIQAGWSLTKIRKIVKSHHYGRKYPALWYLILQKRGYGGKHAKFMVESSTERDIEKGGVSNLWIYNHRFPTDPSLKAAIFKQMEKAVFSKDDYDHYLLLQLLKNEKIHLELKKKYKKFKGPLFKLKRKFYLKLLKRGDMTHFALYQLAKLGDKDLDFLWWVVL